MTVQFFFIEVLRDLNLSHFIIDIFQISYAFLHIMENNISLHFQIYILNRNLIYLNCFLQNYFILSIHLIFMFYHLINLSLNQNYIIVFLLLIFVVYFNFLKLILLYYSIVHWQYLLFNQN